ncbi:MAG TPA: ABC transporter permease [Candidatus Sulfotelmatobacter sp.]|nr:ABC transporter permease [Candidatus Sulfotelmatobacter sp.]
MSKLPFELLLALRYLRPRRTFVSIITLISILGVALGVAVLIIVIGVMSGFDHDLRQQILGFNAPLEIRGTDARPIDNYEEVMRVVSSNKEVTGIAPFITGPVLLETEATNGSGNYFATPIMRGIDANTEGSVSVLPRKILPGGSFDLSGQTVIIGSDFAEQNGLNVGDRVSIYSPSELRKMADELQHGKTNQEAVLPDDYTVSGIFHMGFYEYDTDFIGMSLENAQDLYDLGDSVHGLTIKIRDPDLAAQVKQELNDALGPDFEITTWLEQNSELLGQVVVEKNMMFFLLFFIVLVAALCILSAQITFVVQKTREIGMLKAIGASNLQISGIFLGQSAIIGVFGVLAGLGIGILALTYRNEFLHFMNRLTGAELFPAQIYHFSELPALISPHDVTVICISSFIICLLGGVLPAIRAGRLKPVEALRYE